MNTAWAAKKGFTIIELLVVMVVIGILVTITVVSYSGLQQRSRDSERTSDITQMKIALEKYHADKSGYPDICGTPNACSVDKLAVVLAPYLKAIPHDPKNTINTSADYQYVARSDDTGYAIRVQYEARAVCMVGQNVIASWWSPPTIPLCS